MRPMLPAAMLLAAAVSSSPVTAHEMPRPDGQIVLQLSSEGWVDTDSAKVVAVVQKVLSGDEAAASKDRVPAALHELAPKADWHVIRFDRSRDESGLERWQITAEARLPEGELGGIYDRARNLSKPGQQMEIADVDFTPTLAEREAAEARLRSKIYEDALAEAKRVATAFPDADYRVGRIQFVINSGPQPYARDMMMRAQAAPAPMAEAKSGAMGVSERIVVTATVTIETPPAEQEKEREHR